MRGPPVKNINEKKNPLSCYYYFPLNCTPIKTIEILRVFPACITSKAKKTIIFTITYLNSVKICNFVFIFLFNMSKIVNLKTVALSFPALFRFN